MEQRRQEELKRAYDKEKDHRVVRLMLAVYQVHIRGKSAQEVADDLWMCPDWVRKWVRCFDKGALISSGTSLVVEESQRHRARRLTDT